MNRTPVIVEINPDATTVITAAARVVHPNETGGLLLGWWDNGRVIVRHAVEVPDPAATANAWTREQDRAQSALEAALTKHQHPWLGYVGDWHSHLADQGPSNQDVAAIHRASMQYDQPLVLLVYRADGRFDRVVAHRGRTRPAAIPTGSTGGSTS